MLCKRSSLCRSVGLTRLSPVYLLFPICIGNRWKYSAMRASSAGSYPKAFTMYIACSCGSHTLVPDSHRAPRTEPQTLGMTNCLFLVRLHAQHDPRSRPTKWENKGGFCHLYNPLLLLHGQHAVMVPGQDWRQPKGHLCWSAAGLL